jgi:PilZ domain-containing protein
MRLKRRILEHRLERMTLRANANRPTATATAPPTQILPSAVIARQEPALRPEGCRRRSCRRPVEHEIGVKKLGGFGFQLPTLDVSAEGCRVELVEMVDAGERVIVRLPALEPLGAQVAWVQGANAGLHFQRALHSAVFDQLMDRFVTCAV